jgi:hypothetical protein
VSTYDCAVRETWTDDTEQREVPLAGGDVTEGVVRAGDTVRRPVGPHSPLVHALLTHLESAGFAGAPRFLGIDRSGREVLTYIDGEVAGRPRPPWIADAYGLSGTDRERIIEVAALRTRRSWYLMKQRAETQGGGWQRMWDDGVGDVIKRREAWLDRHAARLTAALTAP